MEPEQQLSLIGLDKFNVLDKINSKLNGKFKLTGSWSLIEYGIIDRPIKDIDIVVDSLDMIKIVFDKPEYNFSEWFDYSEKLESNKDSLQEKGKITNRVSFNIDGVKVDAFFKKYLSSDVFTYLADRKFSVTRPIYSILAKKKYVKNYYNFEFLSPVQLETLKKHSLDIVSYYKNKKIELTSEDDLPF